MTPTKSEDKDQKPEIVSVQTLTPEKMIPKFCTTINVGLLKNKNLVLTMVYNEGKDNVALIERVVIDLDHAKSLHQVLSSVLKEVENDFANSN